MSEAASLGPARRLHPATLIARWLKIVPQLIAGAVALSVSAMRDGRFLSLFIFAIVAMAFAGLMAFLLWWRFTYRIGPREIVIEKGLLQRQRRVIPFDRVQDVSIEQRLLARLFGTARVRIETGGSASDEGNLDMIALDDAHTLRDLVRRGGVPRPVETEAAVEVEAEEPLLFGLGIQRLLLFGLFNFSLIFLAAIGGFIQYLDELGFVEWEDWFTAKRAGEAASLVTVQTILVFAVVVIMLGILAGVARTVARDFGFKLTRSPAGLRRRRGLFTLSEVVIPIQRTQVAVIGSGWISRRFGWYRLSFQTLGADRKERGVQVAVPFGRMEELLPVLAEAGFPPPPPREALHGVPRRALVARILPWLLLGVVAAAVAVTVEPLVAIGAVASVVIAFVAVLRWRKHAWLLGPDTLFVSKGLFRRRLWIIPVGKAQTIFVTRGPVQKRLRLASLLVDTAGARIGSSQAVADLDAADADWLADRLLELFNDARAARRPADRAAPLLS
jgi:putative membrane protein